MPRAPRTTVTVTPDTRAELERLRDAGEFASLDALVHHFARLAGHYPRVLQLGRRGGFPPA